MKKLMVLCLFYTLGNYAIGQQTTLNADYGLSTSLGKESFGYSLSFGMIRQTKEKHSWGIDVDHIFNSSDQGLPSNPADENVTIRTFENPVPYELNTFWDESSFNGYRLKAKPSRYFNFNINMSYYLTSTISPRLSAKWGLGIVASYRDEMEVIGLVNLDQVHIPLPGSTLILNDRKVPIYHYDTYLDFGFTPRALLSYTLSDKIRLGINNRLYTYIFSGNVVFTSTFCVGINLKS